MVHTNGEGGKGEKEGEREEGPRSNPAWNAAYDLLHVSREKTTFIWHAENPDSSP